MPRQPHDSVNAQPDHNYAFLVRARGAWLFPVVLASILAGGLVAAVTLKSPDAEEITAELNHGMAEGFDVIVVTLGSTRADRLGCYGYDRADTPTLDALAITGIRYADAVSPAPLTLPSHASIFTGHDPPKHGVRNDSEFQLASRATTLAEVLQANEYETAGFVSAFELDARYGLNQGFDRYGTGTSPASYFPMEQRGERSAETVTDAALSWLDRRATGDQPFFLWVHYRDPHEPNDAPLAVESAHQARSYDAEVAYVDSQFRRLLTGVRAAGRWNETLIIVAGDHGESLGDHGESGHSRLIYGSTQRVPLLLACPGLVAGPQVVDDVVVGLVDIFPTVLDLLGIESPVPFDGISLVQAANRTDRMIYMETLAPYLDQGWAPLYALRRHSDKFIFAPEREYYSLALDPSERINLYDDMSPRTRRAREELEEGLALYLQENASLNEAVQLPSDPDVASVANLSSLDYRAGTVLESYVDALDPKYLVRTEDHARRAKAFAQSGELEEALAFAYRGLAVSPQDRACLTQIGIIHAAQGRPGDAEQAFRRALEIRASADLYVALANVLVSQGKLDKAWDLLDLAENLEPRHGGIFIARGDIQCQRGSLDEGFEAFHKADRLDPHRFGDVAVQRLVRFQSASSAAGGGRSSVSP